MKQITQCPQILLTKIGNTNKNLITLHSEQDILPCLSLYTGTIISKFKSCLSILHFQFTNFADISHLTNTYFSDFWHLAVDILCHDHISALSPVPSYQTSVFFTGPGAIHTYTGDFFLSLCSHRFSAPLRPAILLRIRLVLIYHLVSLLVLKFNEGKVFNPLMTSATSLWLLIFEILESIEYLIQKTNPFRKILLVTLHKWYIILYLTISCFLHMCMDNDGWTISITILLYTNVL